MRENTHVKSMDIGTVQLSISAAVPLIQAAADARRDNIHRWLSAPDPSRNHDAARKGRQSETGVWFLESQEFSDWKACPDTLLWLYGIPGCGKTVLSSTIIDDILHACQLRPSSAAAYFYFDFNDVGMQSAENMLRSLLTQLAAQNSTPRALETLFSSKMDDGKNQQPSTKELLAVLRQTILEFEETFIIVDALDECAKRKELLGMIKEIAGWKTGNLHTLVTSRREPDIEECFESLPQIKRVSIQNARLNEDIHLYVNERLRTDPKLQRWRNQPEVQKEIADKLMEKADGV